MGSLSHTQREDRKLTSKKETGRLRHRKYKARRPPVELRGIPSCVKEIAGGNAESGLSPEGPGTGGWPQ